VGSMFRPRQPASSQLQVLASWLSRRAIFGRGEWNRRSGDRVARSSSSPVRLPSSARVAQLTTNSRWDVSSELVIDLGQRIAIEHAHEAFWGFVWSTTGRHVISSAGNISHSARFCEELRNFNLTLDSHPRSVGAIPPPAFKRPDGDPAILPHLFSSRGSGCVGST
jgi:hypothetical protein